MSASARKRDMCPHCGLFELTERHMVFETNMFKNKTTGLYEKRLTVYPCVFLYEERHGFREISQEDLAYAYAATANIIRSCHVALKSKRSNGNGNGTGRGQA